MSDTSELTIKLERILGDSYEEIMEKGRHPPQKMNKNEMKTIGYTTYDPKTGKIKYTPKQEKYKEH